MVLAQEEARVLNNDHIGSEHLVLGVLRERDSLGARALGGLGITLDALRTVVGSGTAEGVGSPPFTSGAKKMLESALREALQCGHNYIGPEHLLLGLTRDPNSSGSRALTGMGANPDQIREQVLGLMAAEPAPWATNSAVGRCPTCQSEIERLASRVIPAEPDPAAPEGAPTPSLVVALCCPRCGTVLGVLPMTSGPTP